MFGSLFGGMGRAAGGVGQAMAGGVGGGASVAAAPFNMKQQALMQALGGGTPQPAPSVQQPAAPQMPQPQPAAMPQSPFAQMVSSLMQRRMQNGGQVSSASGH